VIGRPVARELLVRRQLHALRPIGDQLPGGPTRRGDAPAQVDDCLFGNVDVEGTDYGCGFGGLGVHNSSPLWCYMTEGPGEGAAREPRTAPSHELLRTTSPRQHAAWGCVPRPVRRGTGPGTWSAPPAALREPARRASGRCRE